MNTKQLKIGTVLSYLFLILNTVSALFLTPFILQEIGKGDYGVYKTMTSLSSSVAVLQLGLGGTAMRYISRFCTDDEREKIPNFLAMCILQVAVIIAGVAVVCGILYLNIGKIYTDGLSVPEIDLAKKLFVIICLNLLVHIFSDLLTGIITGFNRFIFPNGITLIRLLIRIILVFVLLPVIKSAVVLVMIEVVLSVILVAIQILYIKFKLDVKIKLVKWDNRLFRESFGYTFLLFVGSIINQVNGNLDNVVIGALRGAALVTVYSVGLMLFHMFDNLSSSISMIMLPTVTQLLKNDTGYQKTYRFIIKVGRIQFLILGAALSGFICIGKDFISVWLGSGFSDVYFLALILMVPALFELIVNVCLSILRAENKLGFKTKVLFTAAVMNALITFFGVKYWSYYAAAIGTSLSVFLGSVIVMNIYYYKEFGFRMIKMYRAIFGKLWICMLIATAALYTFSRYIHGSYPAIASGIVVYCAVYGVALVLFGLNSEEKQSLQRIVKRRKAE